MKCKVMCSLIHNGIKCNDVYLQRCFNHLILLMFNKKVKISEINIISCGCPKNNTGNGHSVSCFIYGFKFQVMS